MLKLLISILFISQFIFAEDEIFYRQRPDILKAVATKTETSDKLSVEVWEEMKKVLPQTIAFFLEAYPEEDLYFLGRDGEYLYDFARAIVSEKERKRIHLINVSRSNMTDPNLKNYLDQMGISDISFASGRKVVLIDTGFYGTIIEKISQLYPDFSSTHIKKQLILSEKKSIPSLRLFLKGFSPWAVYLDPNDLHGKINLLEHLPHFSKKSTSFDFYRGKWDAKSREADAAEKKTMKYLQADLKKLVDQPQTKKLFIQKREEYKKLFYYLSQKDEKKLVDALQALDKKGEKEVVLDFYEVTKTNYIDDSLFPYLNSQKRKIILETELKKDPAWRKILENPEEELTKVYSKKWFDQNKALIEGSLFEKPFRQKLLQLIGSSQLTSETQPILMDVINMSHAETMNEIPKFIFANSKNFDEDLSVAPIKRFLEINLPDGNDSFVRNVIQTPHFASMDESLSILENLSEEVESYFKPIVLERIKEIKKMKSAKESYKLLSLSSEEEKLRWIAYLKSKVPDLVSSAGKYQVDLMEVLDDQAKLQDLLSKNPEFLELTKYKNDHLLTSVIIPTVKAEVKSYEISPKALGDWKEILMNEYKALPINNQVDVLREKIYDLSHKLGNHSSDGLETGLILTLSKSQQQEVFKLGSEGRISYLSEVLPEKIDPSFKFSLYGISPKANKWEVITALREILKIENELKNLVELYLVLQKHNGQLYENAFQRITNLKSSDFELFVRTDDLKSRLRMLSDDLKDFYGEKLSKNIDRVIHLDIKSYVKKIPVKVEKVIDGVRLVEVSAQEGIFRGCTGGDCSTMASFPYPNDPSEKVFYVYDKNNRVKGYVSGTKVKIKDGYGFYVITIAGSRISSADTQLILNGLSESKDVLGVDKILLPPQERLNRLVNYNVIRSIFENSAYNEIIPIEYIHKDIRSAIENFPSMYSEEIHDKMETNKISVEYRSLNQLKVTVTHRYNQLVLPTVDSKLYRQTALELALAYYQFSGDEVAYSRVLKNLRMDRVTQDLVLDTMSNEKRLPLAQYKEELIKLFGYSPEEMEKKIFDFPAGILNCPDLKEVKYTSILERYIELKNDQFKQLRHRFSEEILESKILTKLMIEMGDEKVLLYFNYFIFSQPSSFKMEEEFMILLKKLSPKHYYVVLESVFSKPHSINFQQSLLFILENLNEKSLNSLRKVTFENEFWKNEALKDIIEIAEIKDKAARKIKIDQLKIRMAQVGCAPWFKPLGEIR